MLTKSMQKNSLVLAIFALVTSLLLASTYLGTKDSISEAERRAAQKILQEIYSENQHDNDLLEDVLPVPEAYLVTLGLKSPANIHVVRNNGEITGFIIPATAPDGYSGDIRLLAGVNVEGSLAGVRVLAHNETPGLGDKVDTKKSDWILEFDGKSLNNPKEELWTVKKDKGYFDQFTGATITPRAVVSRVYKTLIFYREHSKELIKSAQSRHANQAAGNGSSPTEGLNKETGAPNE